MLCITGQKTVQAVLREEASEATVVVTKEDASISTGRVEGDGNEVMAGQSDG